MKLGLLLSTILGTQAFLSKPPLKQIALSRAVTSTITEALALNVFDTSAIIHELVCDCEQHPLLPVYVGGFLVFSYFYVVNSDEDRLTSVEFYANFKRNMRIILFTLFLILGKSVDSAI
jgi:hypothetical protein